MNTPLSFYKYQGTGNDFVMIDNRDLHFPHHNTQWIEFLCNRRMGIGADGLILIEHSAISDFKMVYFNSDGKQSTMCGNGGRCIVAFAKQLNIIDNKCTFEAVDGIHHATIENDMVSLQMADVTHIEVLENGAFLNTGSPHHVKIVENAEDTPVYRDGKNIRNSPKYSSIGGTNVNFVEILSEATYKVRTYERGVEDETLSCGTGVTAVAIAMHHLGKTNQTEVQLQVLGGKLRVSFVPTENGYEKIFLKGAATFVFHGNIKK